MTVSEITNDAATCPEVSIRGWSVSKSKRIFDFVAALAGLIVLAPVMVATAIAVKLSSRGPALFRQIRMGWHGRTFTIYKFRTMRLAPPNSGPSVTKAGDARLTSVGRFLRSTKLDELPQLLNVLFGNMSLVGPRPKVPLHQTYELRVRPGITGAASIAFRNEESVIRGIPEDLLDDYQVNVLMPVKKALDEKYAGTATFYSDLVLMMRTVFGGGELVDVDGVYALQHSLISLSSAIEDAEFEHEALFEESAA